MHGHWRLAKCVAFHHIYDPSDTILSQNDIRQIIYSSGSSCVRSNDGWSINHDSTHHLQCMCSLDNVSTKFNHFKYTVLHWGDIIAVSTQPWPIPVWILFVGCTQFSVQSVSYSCLGLPVANNATIVPYLSLLDFVGCFLITFSPPLIYLGPKTGL